MRPVLQLYALISSVLIIFSCGPQVPSEAAFPSMNAALWIAKAAEYEGVARQTYRAALPQLEFALKDTNWTAALEQQAPYGHLPPAIILDLDETVQRTTDYTAWLMQESQAHNDSLWREWVEREISMPVPGALEFCRKADAMGVTVLYVTNTRQQMLEATYQRLVKGGFPLRDGKASLYLRTDTGDKSSRRAQVARTHRILLIFGDDANDFATGFRSATQAERDELSARYRDRWGVKWFVLPNPMYGSWLSAITRDSKGNVLMQRQINALVAP